MPEANISLPMSSQGGKLLEDLRVILKDDVIIEASDAGESHELRLKDDGNDKTVREYDVLIRQVHADTFAVDLTKFQLSSNYFNQTRELGLASKGDFAVFCEQTNLVIFLELKQSTASAVPGQIAKQLRACGIFKCCCECVMRVCGVDAGALSGLKEKYIGVIHGSPERKINTSFGKKEELGMGDSPGNYKSVVGRSIHFKTLIE